MDVKKTNVPMVLVGDLGATNARLAIMRGKETLAQSVYRTKEHGGLSELVMRFLKEEVEDGELTTQLQVSCFGVAGPVRDGAAHLTNVGWGVSEQEINQLLGLPALIVNDFYAQAAAVPHLGDDALVHLCGPSNRVINAGQTISVLGAGSGLGQATLISRKQSDLMTSRTREVAKTDHSDWFAIATEGGHARFAPRNEQEVGLHRWLQGHYGEHVSVERVVSGPGIVDLFKYFLGSRPVPVGFEEPIKGEDISRSALAGQNQVAETAMQHFVGVYADEAANLALKSNAGLVYLSGGITPHILPLMKQYFPSSFVAKGRYKDWLSRVGVWVVSDPLPAMIGARALAEQLFYSLTTTPET